MIGQVRWKLQGISYIVPKCHELWSTNGFNSTELCEMPKRLDRNFYSASVNARYDYDASRIRWRRVLNVNETIEIKSLVSRAPKGFKFAMASRRAA